MPRPPKQSPALRAIAGRVLAADAFCPTAYATRMKEHHTLAERALIRKAMAALGSRTTPGKSAASRANGALGGRPRNRKDKP